MRAEIRSGPNAGATIRTQNSKTFTGTGAVVFPVFRITGCVRILKLGGTVTTLHGNATAASFRLNDQTAVLPITSAAGTVMTAAPVGSTIAKLGLVAAALSLISSAAGALAEPTTLETLAFSEFLMQKKIPAANTDIEYVFTTTDNPTTGAILFWCEWQALSSDGAVSVI
jgi:hypothetical protein